MLSPNRLAVVADFIRRAVLLPTMGAAAFDGFAWPCQAKKGRTQAQSFYNNAQWELGINIKRAAAAGFSADSGPVAEWKRLLGDLVAIRGNIGLGTPRVKISNPEDAVNAARSGGIDALRRLAAEAAAALKEAEKGTKPARKGARFVAKGPKGKVAPETPPVETPPVETK